MWAKQGIIISPREQADWCASHASLPTVVKINNVWRVFYSTRDQKGRSRITFSDVEPGNPSNVLYHHPGPIMELGEIGTFDDCGQMPVWAELIGDEIYLYFAGWSVKNTVTFDNHTGLAILGSTIKKYPGPVLSKTPYEPYFTGTLGVLREPWGIWRGYYMSGVRWEMINNHPEPFYDMKYAESFDGIHWTRNGRVVIPLNEGEGGICKASVLKDQGVYKMWYSYRRGRDYRTNKENSYRIGYAESPDGLDWTRMDDKGVDVSADGWDSAMTCFPCVVKYNDTLFMFYNGNHFGRTGIGYATAR